jgi:hypothetical protein
VSHAYWRVYFTAQTGTFALAMATVELRATLGGADQCFGVATASASSTFSSFAATIWSSLGVLTTSGSPNWLAFAFPGAVTVEQLAITTRPDVDGHPTDWYVQSSDDGVTYVTEWVVTGETGWALGETRTYDRQLPDLASTKSTTYAVLGAPLLLSSTKSVMYVISGAPRGLRFKARLVTQPR